MKYFKKQPRTNFVYAGVIAAGLLGSFYYSHLEEVPITQRRRFVAISKEKELEYGLKTYKAILDSYHDHILPSYHPLSQQVQSVVTQLTQLPELKGQNWKVHVINSNIPNAFVVAGGHIFVFTGILPIANTSDKLSAVLSHEIAHVVARHHAEGQSLQVGLAVLASAINFFINPPEFLTNMIIQLGLDLPHSRMRESEADEIGLYLMSKACFDPHGATQYWQSMLDHRVSAIDPSKQKGMSDFWSTHPADQARIDNIRLWMDKAEQIGMDAGCHHVSLFRSHMTRFS